MCSCESHAPKSDLSLLDEAVARYGGDPTNLITVLQEAQ